MKELIAALAAALPEVEGASKDKNNPHFKTKYADLSSVIEAIRPVAAQGLWFRQSPIEHEKGACIETFYVHSSGQEMSAGKCYVPASKNDAQGFGSAMTYCRRYGLLAAFGIAPEDDDGNAAINSPAAKVVKISPDDVQVIKSLASTAAFDDGKILTNFGVNSLDDLTQEQADNTIVHINGIIDQKRIKEAQKEEK